MTVNIIHIKQTSIFFFSENIFIIGKTDWVI